MRMPASPSAISRPMLLITVAATVPPRSVPRAAMRVAQMYITASPSTVRPAWSTNRARSPSPSKATPRSQRASTTVRATASRWVEPQRRLMLRPSGSHPIATTSNPRSRSSLGARPAVAPLAQSTASRRACAGAPPASAPRA